jgi:hypothetical protein
MNNIDSNKIAKDIIVEDTAITSPIGLKLKFNPVTIHHKFKSNSVWLKE